MDKVSLEFAIKRVVGEVDYDIWKSIETPEDDDAPTWEDLVEIFIEAYEEDQAFQQEDPEDVNK